MNVLHRELAGGTWFAKPILDQLGNIGSEISRASRWRTANPTLSRNALFRALDLFDLTLADPKHSRARRREVARAREVVVDFFDGDNRYGSSPENLQKYFDAFAIAARR